MKRNLLIAVLLSMFFSVGLFAGTGVYSDPYTCAEAIAIGKDIPAGTYVYGYIVGGRYDDFDYNSNEYGISIADAASETDVANCFQVKLPSDKRAAWHPKNDASLIGKMVIVSGSGDGYGNYPAVENNVTIEFYTPPVTGAPVMTDILPKSGSDYYEGEAFNVSATVTTTDAAGIDSVCLAYGDASDALNDTVKMSVSNDSVYSTPFVINDKGTYFGKIVAFGGNSTSVTSSLIEVIVMAYDTIDMTKANYQIIVDTVNARGLNTATYNETVSENYYGASANYSNFSVGSGKFSSNFATADSAIAEAISTILLPAKRTTAAVNDTFVVNYAMYGGDASDGAMTFVCTATVPLTFAQVIAVTEPHSTYSVYSIDSVGYQIIVDTVANRGGSVNTDQNEEYYFGASSKYANFACADGKFDASFVTADSAQEVAISTILLPVVKADAEVGDTVEVNYKMYKGDTPTGTMYFTCTATDPLAFVRYVNEVIDSSVIDMVKADYQIIVDTVSARGLNTHSYPANSENYYGASAYNGNFDAREGNYSLDFSSSEAAIAEALSAILLPALRSGAEVTDTFTVNYAIYNGSTEAATMEFACTATSPLTFKYTGTLPEPEPIDSSKLEMLKPYYQIIVDSVTARGLNTSGYDNSENYYGASAAYGNFSIADGKYSDSFSSADAAIEEALRTIVLPALRAESSVQDSITVYYNTYDGSSTVADSMTFVCTSTSPLTFKYTGTLPDAISEDVVSDFAVYPNPATTSICFTKDVERVVFISLSGKVVMTATQLSAEQPLDISTIGAGLFFVKTTGVAGSQISKLIVR